MSTFNENSQDVRGAYVTITEQPAPIVRFRYESEERNAGLLLGASSTPDTKTFPSIQVVGYRGRAIVLVSLVTAEEPYRPHPHGLMGKDCCNAGVCFLQISPETMAIQFRNLKIQRVKKRDINGVLKLRKSKNIDPFKTGFSYKSPIDTNRVRLCFQVFLEGNEQGKCNIPLTPVVSEPIVHKSTMPDLVIVELSDCVSRADGDNKKIILLCEKIFKDDDIEIRFYEEKNGKVVWQGFGEFQPSRVHKHVAISFHPPRYHDPDISEPVNVFVQMRRPSDGATSDSLPFQILPALDRKRKRQRLSNFLDLGQEVQIKNTSAPEYKINQTSHATMDMEEDIKGVFALSRVPDPQRRISDPSFEVYTQGSAYIAQEQIMNQLAQVQPSTSVQGTPAVSTQTSFQNRPSTLQFPHISPQNTPFVFDVAQASSQKTSATNSVQTTPSVILNQNEPHTPRRNSNNENTPPKINQLPDSGVQNMPQISPMNQPSFISFQNTPATIDQLTQLIVQNIPSILNQLAQSGIQNMPSPSSIQNTIGSQLIQTNPGAKQPTIGTVTSPTINLLPQSNLQISPSSANQPIQFIFQNPPSTNSPQNAPSTMEQHIQATSQNTPNASNRQVVDSQQWNIILPSQEENSDQSANSERTEPERLSNILEGIRNSELVEPITLNSGELGSFEGVLDLNNLSEVLSNNLSLTDIDERPDQNMSDSLTRLINSSVETNKFW